ncbi:MAG: VCBS repeat-containing protein [Planctomycetes bacterium]|nr:VCBS repeat-containing protein [Planctomycetota bacterium]
MHHTRSEPLTPFRHLFEQAGGTVGWIHESKTVEAEGLGRSIRFRIGEQYGLLDGASAADIARADDAVRSAEAVLSTAVTGTHNGKTIVWYANDGGSPPTFTERVISNNADFAASVFAADLDGDGDTDVLSASTNDDKIAWYENVRHCGFDSDCDGDVDLDDFVQFQAAFVGP